MTNVMIWARRRVTKAGKKEYGDEAYYDEWSHKQLANINEHSRWAKTKKNNSKIEHLMSRRI